jgi:hypothetical protein
VILSLISLLLFSRKTYSPYNFSFRRSLIVISFAALPLLPIGAFNYFNTGGFYVTAPNGGITFYEGNNPRARGTYSSIARISDDVNLELEDMVKVALSHFGRPVTVWEADRYFWHKGLSYIKSKPANWLKLELKKIILLFWIVTVFFDYQLSKVLHFTAESFYFLCGKTDPQFSQKAATYRQFIKKKIFPLSVNTPILDPNGGNSCYHHLDLAKYGCYDYPEHMVELSASMSRVSGTGTHDPFFHCRRSS